MLAGKNVISGFGTNNYQKALEKFIAKARGDRDFMGGRGTAAEMGSFKDGGLVSMFVEKK